MEWCPRRESNSRLWLRRPALYPLSYRGLYHLRISWAHHGQQGDYAPLCPKGSRRIRAQWTMVGTAYRLPPD